jgi:hypothetical protein
MSSMRSRKTLMIGVTVNLEHYENLRLEVSGEVGSTDDADDLVGYLDEVLGRMGREDQTTADRIDSYRRRVLAMARKEPFPAADSGCKDKVCPLPAELLPDAARPASTSQAGEQRTRPKPGMPPVPLSSPGAVASVNPPEGHPVRSSQKLKALPDSSGEEAGGSSGLPRTGSPPAATQDSFRKETGPVASPVAGTPGETPSRAGAPSLSSPPASSGSRAPDTGVEGSALLPEKATILTPDARKSGGEGTVSPGGPVCDLCSAPITEAERKTSQLFTSKNLCRTCMKRT